MKKDTYSKKILKILTQKPAIAVPELLSQVGIKTSEKKPLYAISRSLRGLEQAGLLDRTFSGQQDYARITKAGKKRAHSIILEQETTLVNPSWDGKWRMVMLDLPESRKDERESLRYLLKKAGFVCLKNSVWISPFPYEYFFANMKKDFGFTNEMMIIVTDTVDEATEKIFFDELTVPR